MKKFVPDIWIYYIFNGVTTLGITKITPDDEMVVMTLDFSGMVSCKKWYDIQHLDIKKLNIKHTETDILLTIHNEKIMRIFEKLNDGTLKPGKA